jgi:hypothetical protein
MGGSGVARMVAALCLLGVAACADSDAPPSDSLPLNPVALPPLSCRAPLSNAGECTRGADCGDGQRCALDERVEVADREPLSLRCGPALGTGRARARCSEGGECESGLCGLSGVCLEPCSSPGDCESGQTCQPVEVRVRVDAPDGRHEDALAPVQACARVAAYPADVKLALSTQKGLRRGVINRFTVSELAGTSLVFLKADCERTMRVQRIVDRSSGRVFFDAAEQLEGVVQINPSINEGALVPLLLPNNPRVTLNAAGYDLGVSVDDDTDLQVIRASRQKRGHILDLNVFYVGGGKMVEAGGLHPGSQEFAAVIARLSERYRELGIELGAVREYDVVGALRAELAVLEVDSDFGSSGMLEQDVKDLDRVFELSAGTDDGGVNLFILEKIGPLLGISGGTPGALGLHGSSVSGVALALDSAGLERADKVLFHELGHQLGLFHTNEMDGFEIEPLSDTLACSAEQDTDGDGLVRVAECLDYGADNVMFWEGVGDATSAQQRDVLTRALVLR